MKLTTTIARNLELPNGKTDHFEWDEVFPGFGIRLRVGRNRVSRMWIYQYDIAGRTRRITLGNVNAIGIDDARKTAGQLQGKVRLGHDPVGEKAESRARLAHTFASVMETYLTMAKLEQRASTWRNTKFFLKALCKPLHPLPFTAITRREIAAVLTPIAASGKRPTSNRVRANLSALFNWAISQDLTENNPVVGTVEYPRAARERVLSLPELAAIWHALDDIPIKANRTADFANAIRLLMLTGQRRTEIGDLRWREVRAAKTFIDEGLPITGPAIVLPPERVKNNRKHIVPLSEPALAILLMHPRGTDDGFILKRKGIPWGERKAMLDFVLSKLGHHLAPWLIHDLRRSVATHMGEMGIQPHVIECVLNHTGGFRAGDAGVYNRSKLEEPKRQALEAWAEVLIAHVEGRSSVDKVVPFRA